MNHSIGRVIEWQQAKRPDGLDYRDIPVVVTSFNRLECLAKQIEWLEAAGTRRITILDNASTYPPLLEYLGRCGHEVIRLNENLGPYAFWKSGLAKRFWNDFYVLTDPDVVPMEGCPVDIVGHLYTVLQRYRNVRRVGIGLNIDDLPDCFSQKQKVVQWESQFWQRQAEPGLYWAGVDTTFALYRPRTVAGDGASLRTGSPYIARHLPWYADSAQPTEEELHYRRCVLPGGSWWAEGTEHNVREHLLGVSAVNG